MPSAQRHLSECKYHKKKKKKCNFQVNTDFQLFNSNSVAVLSRKLIGFDLLRVSTTCQQARPVDSFPPLWMNKRCLSGLKNRIFLTAIGHLEQVVLPKLLEHAPFDLDELRLGGEEREF